MCKTPVFFLQLDSESFSFAWFPVDVGYTNGTHRKPLGVSITPSPPSLPSFTSFHWLMLPGPVLWVRVGWEGAPLPSPCLGPLLGTSGAKSRFDLGTFQAPSPGNPHGVGHSGQLPRGTTQHLTLYAHLAKERKRARTNEIVHIVPLGAPSLGCSRV